MNGYTPEKWLNAKPPKVVCEEFARWLKPFCCIEKISERAQKSYYIAQLAGYNNAKFDDARIQKLFQDNQVFLPADYGTLDVLQLVRWYFKINPTDRPENLKLATVCQHFGVDLENAHDALVDVTATAELAGVVGENLIEYVIENFVPAPAEPARSAPLRSGSRDPMFDPSFCNEDEIPF